MFTTAQVTTENYVSYFVSPYHTWFVQMGYPELDIHTFEDGEWSFIQFMRSPVVPSLTPWNYVLTGLKHVEKSPWICQKYAQNLDLEKKAFWADLDAREAAIDRENAARERHDEEIAQARFTAIRKNDALVERIAKFGLQEMNPLNILRHIPNHAFRTDHKNPCSIISPRAP